MVILFLISFLIQVIQVADSSWINYVIAMHAQAD